MGSLMAGWNSPVNRKMEKSKSFTKEEIEAFWKLKKQQQNEHLKSVSDVVDSSSSSSSQAIDDFSHEQKEALKKLDAWWTRSNWAFLNEPPVEAMEGPAYKYAAQYHVANAKKSSSGIDVA